MQMIICILLGPLIATVLEHLINKVIRLLLAPHLFQQVVTDILTCMSAKLSDSGDWQWAKQFGDDTGTTNSAQVHLYPGINMLYDNDQIFVTASSYRDIILL